MFKKTKFEVILRKLEEPVASKKQLDQLCEYLKNDNVYNPIFESYVSRRLHVNIHPEKLLNMAYHLEERDKTKYLSRTLNRQVVSHMLLKDQCFDQFYFMNRHDLRKDNHILNSLIENFFDYSPGSFDIFNKIAPKIEIDKYELILRVMDSGEFRSFRNLTMTEKMPIEERRLLLIKALETHNPRFEKLLEWAKADTRNHISGLLIRDGDNDQFATALRNTMIPITQLEMSYDLNQFLEAHANDIPGTLARLYYRAEQEERWEYLLILGANKNKKELLRSIVKSKDHELIDKFFSLYKNSPEVKHLVPFL